MFLILSAAPWVWEGKAVKVDSVEVRENLYYTAEHGWASLEEDGLVRVGVADYAQRMLHEVVFVQLPEKDAEVKQKDSLGSLESVKAVAEVYSPLSGRVVEVNEALKDSPELINRDPYGKGWIARLKPKDLKELESLMKAEDYAEYVKQQLEA